jgi:TatD DNase family protein
MTATPEGVPSLAFADSHVHLASPQFAADVHDVIARAQTAGAALMVCIGESPEAAARARDIAAQYPGLIATTIGLHPHDASAWTDAHPHAIREGVAAGAVAIGECGLDYHYDHSPRDVQRRVFAEQLALAAALDRPVVVHTREAEADTIAMVREAGAHGVRGVLHCFTGSAALADAALDVGWLLSLSGVITFKRYADDDLLRRVPPDRLMVESDAPYLAPVPHRGHRNEPAWVPLTLAKLAAVLGEEVAITAARTLHTTRTFFRIASDAATSTASRLTVLLAMVCTSALLGLGAMVLAPRALHAQVVTDSAAAQRADSLRADSVAAAPRLADTARAVPVRTRRIAPVAKPPLSPRQAFLVSFMVPGLGQARLDRTTSGALFAGVEMGAVLMLRRSLENLRDVRSASSDTLPGNFTVDPSTGQLRPTGSVPPRFEASMERSRKLFVEDWIAAIVFNHLIAGADAFVSAQLWDVPRTIAVVPTRQGLALTASIRW